jgi:hypothetical protein
MPNEANVVGFSSAADPTSAVESPNVRPIDAAAILGGALFDWADLTFPAASSDGTANLGKELPVTGLLVKTRTLGTPDRHYGQIQDHGYQPAAGGVPPDACIDCGENGF